MTLVRLTGRIAILFVTAFILTFASGSGAAADNANNPLTSQVDALFKKWDKPDSPGFAVGIVRDGKVIYSRGYGSANLDHEIPLGGDSVFYLASVSKQFTAACIALLVQEGKLSLDDDVRKHVPELPAYPKTVTIRHLIHHTSGIKDYLTLQAVAGLHAEDVRTEHESLQIVCRQPELNFEPGEKFLYSNSGYLLMAIIVRRVSGKSMAEFAQEKIFTPLGMTHTHFHDDRGVIVKKRVTAYSEKSAASSGDAQSSENAPTQYRVNDPRNYAQIGSGGLYSCVNDLTLWNANFDDSKVGGPAFLEMILTPGKLNDGKAIEYGFGLTIGRYKGLKAITHSGGFMGFRTNFLRLPEQKLSVICLANGGQLDPIKQSHAIADIYLPKEIESALGQYAGNYSNSQLPAKYELKVTGTELFADSGDNDLKKIEYRGVDDTFTLDGVSLKFERDAEQKVIGYVLDTVRAGKVRFERADK